MYNIEESGKRLKALRVKAGKTQMEVAADLGVALESISRIERGVRGASVDMIEMLKDYYGTTADFIISGKETGNAVERLLAGYPEEKQQMALKILKGILENI